MAVAVVAAAAAAALTSGRSATTARDADIDRLGTCVVEERRVSSSAAVSPAAKE